MDIQKSGTRKNLNYEFTKSKSASRKMLTRSGLVGGKQLLAPFGAISNNFSMGQENINNLMTNVFFVYLSWWDKWALFTQFGVSDISKKSSDLYLSKLVITTQPINELYVVKTCSRNVHMSLTRERN